VSDTSAKSAVVQGLLKDRPFARLLQQLYRKQFTGHFVVSDETQDESEIYLRDGSPVHVHRPVDTDRLDNLLVEYGVVPADVVATASAQVTAGLRLGAVLERMGALDKERLAQVLKSQVIRKLTRLFFVTQGKYAIYLDPHAYGEGEELSLMRVDPRSVIYAGIRAAYDLPRVTQELTRLLGQRFKLMDVPDSYLVAMAIPPDDATVESLRRGFMTLDDLDHITARQLDVRSITLALYYADLLVRESYPSPLSDSAIPRPIHTTQSSELNPIFGADNEAESTLPELTEPMAIPPTFELSQENRPSPPATVGKGTPAGGVIRSRVPTPHSGPTLGKATPPAPTASQPQVASGSPSGPARTVATPSRAPETSAPGFDKSPVAAASKHPSGMFSAAPATNVPVIETPLAPSQSKYPSGTFPAAPQAAGMTGKPSLPTPPAPARPVAPQSSASHPRPAAPIGAPATPIVRAPFVNAVRGDARATPVPPAKATSSAASPAQAGSTPDVLRAAILDMAQKLGKVNHFELLGVPQSASADEIGIAFVRAARQFHPDRLVNAGVQDLQPTAERILSRINEAAMVLGDARRRAEYVASLSSSAPQIQTSLPTVLEAENTFLKGEVFLKKGDFGKAIEAFTAATMGNPNEPQYRAYLAWARFEDPRTRKETVVRETLRTLEAVVKDRPKFARGYFWIGQLWKFLNEIDKAGPAFREAVQIDNTFIEASRELRLIEMRKARSGGKSGHKSEPSKGGLMGKFFKK
jgi:curved DNA-binding protein CbpA